MSEGCYAARPLSPHPLQRTVDQWRDPLQLVALRPQLARLVLQLAEPRLANRSHSPGTGRVSDESAEARHGQKFLDLST